MKSAKVIPVTNGSITALFDTGAAEQLLRVDSGIDWPNGMEPRDVRIERGWPTRKGGFVVEWSFRLGGGSRCTLFGAQYDDAEGIAQDDTKSPILTAHGIRGVLVHVPGRGVRIHSLDRDGAMPHLAHCLNEREMAERLSPFWNGGVAGQPDGPHDVECCPLSYRVGRRATISYRWRASNSTSGQLVGKTYCDGRGERLLRLHEALDQRLASSTGDRVRVPTVVHYFSDLQITLFAWVPRDKTGPSTQGSNGFHDQARLAADALAALHAQSVPDLADFSLTDECAITARWQAALAAVDAQLAETVRPVTDALLACAESVPTNACCTVHRDFYDAQFVFDGRTITLLDLDTLAQGDPCVDLGNLLAHMFLAAVRARASKHEFPAAAKLMLRRYMDQRARHWDASPTGVSECARPTPETLAYYWASALFRVGAVHALRTSTGRYAPLLWQLAGELLAEFPAGRAVGRLAADGRAVLPNPREILEELLS